MVDNGHLPNIKDRVAKHPISNLARRKINVGGLELGFQRTCRVPYDRVSSLPAGLGYFPIYSVSDFEDRTPDDWESRDCFMPMYQCEALWISFSRVMYREPYAAIIGSGGINAVTGKQIEDVRKGYELEETQNYLSIPPQPWLDGWKDVDGNIYQFVAAELGSGETVEGQITGEETVGGIQIAVFKPKPDADLTPASRPREYMVAGGWPYTIYDKFPDSRAIFLSFSGQQTLGGLKSTGVTEKYAFASMDVRSMGLGRGGQIRQKIYDDPYGLEVWQAEPAEVRMVHIVNSDDFRTITGHNPPPTPITHKTYQMYGYPWFELWDSELEDTTGSDVFGKLKPVMTGKKKVPSKEEAKGEGKKKKAKKNKKSNKK